MAAIEMCETAEIDNPMQEISTLSHSVQGQATRASYLIRAIDGIADEIASLDRSQWSLVMEAVDRIVVFAQMAEDAAKRAGDFAVKIEMASFVHRASPKAA